MNGVAQQSWLLVAPWFRWPAQGVKRDGVKVRDTWPAIQKYATFDPVGAFVKQPQHSLKFLAEEDFFQYAEALPILPQLPPPLDRVKRRLSDSRLVTTTTRKLFLDSHHRMYLVVVQLVRDEPGYPCVSRDEVCQMGFVVRRRRLVSSRPLDRSVGQIMRDVYVQAWRHQEVTRFLKHLDSTDTAVPGEALLALSEARASVTEDLRRERERLATWARDANAGFVVEGWIPTQHQNIGSWQSIAATPQTLTEKTYPLYAMAPDPDDKEHDAHNTTLYFGLVPTSGSDVDDSGNARFDDGELYEVRCFVRRHDQRCLKTHTKVPDCHGPLVWTIPSEAYRLAAQMDLVGTSNHVVTVQAPDMPALAAQSAALGKAVAPVRVVTPPGSSFQFTQPFGTPDATGSSIGGAAQQICFFMIPLFTIVALFLFTLFLPVILLIFQVWWMLALKLCIPPSLSLAGNVTAELDALAALNLHLDASLTTTLDDQFAALAGGAAKNQDFRDNTLLPNLKKDLGDSPGAQLLSVYSTDALVRMHQAMANAAAAPRSLSARLQFEDHVSRSQVVLV